MSDDSLLLRQFAEDHSQAAFTTLVQRHVNLVYSAALRQLGGDAHLAWDAAQGVFLALAQNAPRLEHHAALTGWLYTTTRFICAKIVRMRQRTRGREEAAFAMNEILHEGVSDLDWSVVRPVLDAAMHELSATDRQALLLRHFEERSFAEIGARCGLGENAARMRVERALEKLRARLARRGIVSTAAALGAGLTAHGVGTAPAGLASAAAALGFAGATTTIAGSAAAFGWLHFLAATNLKVAAAAGVLALAVGGYVGAEWQRRREPPVIAASASQLPRDFAALPTENPRPASAFRKASPPGPVQTPSAPAAPLNQAEEAVAAATQKALAASTRSGLDQSYGSLFRRLQLPPAELERFRDLLTERQLSSFDALFVAQTHGIRLDAGPAELKAAMDKVRADVDASIRTFLGPERYALYQDFNGNAATYILHELIERRLGYSNAPLQASQSQPLLRLLLDAAATHPAPPPSAHGALSMVDALAGGAMARGPLADETIAQAQSFLTPPQMEILRHIQTDQRNQTAAFQALGQWPPGVVTDRPKPDAATPVSTPPSAPSR
jgi:RNA polymerase sigma factor (sigma-70 family)